MAFYQLVVKSRIPIEIEGEAAIIHAALDDESFDPRDLLDDFVVGRTHDERLTAEMEPAGLGRQAFGPEASVATFRVENGRLYRVPKKTP